MQRWNGLGVAMVTPFTTEGKLDLSAVERLTKHLVDGYVDYLVPIGTTGESVTLTNEETEDLLEVIFASNTPRIPVLLGCGGNDTRKVAKRMERFASKFKISGFLSVSPYYNKPTQEGIFQHYTFLSQTTDLPIILYNIPGRTASEIFVPTVLRLAENKHIVAVKDATGDLIKAMHLIKNKPADFQVLAGDDAITLPALACGFEGVISVIGNALPLQFGQMVRAAMQEDFSMAKKMHLEMIEIIDLLFREGNPAGIKAALKSLGICGTTVRLPLLEASDALQNEIEIELKRILELKF